MCFPDANGCLFRREVSLLWFAIVKVRLVLVSEGPTSQTRSRATKDKNSRRTWFWSLKSHSSSMWLFVARFKSSHLGLEWIMSASSSQKSFSEYKSISRQSNLSLYASLVSIVPVIMNLSILLGVFLTQLMFTYQAPHSRSCVER